MKVMCNVGCQQEFTLNGFLTVDMSNEVEKTYFQCEHCKQEYVAFYTDPEIRELQEKIRQVHKGLIDPAGQADAIEQEQMIKTQIKGKMDALRASIEGG